jgi:hypothetical protein
LNEYASKNDSFSQTKEANAVLVELRALRRSFTCYISKKKKKIRTVELQKPYQIMFGLNGDGVAELG